MSVKPRPRTKSATLQRLLTLFAVLALIATACGGASENETAAAIDEVVNETVEDDSTAQDNSTADTVAGEADVDTAGEAAEQAVEDKPAAEVLAFAIQAAEELSYSYEQGLQIDANILGQRLVMGGEDAFATGLVNGNDMTVNADIGSFMVSMFESLGLSLDDPALGAMLEGFSTLEMDVWMVDDTIVMDLTDFANTLAGLDPAAASEMAIFMDGPVSVDLAQLEALGGPAGSTDATSIVAQFGQGAQITDPGDILEALRDVDALVEAGSDTVNGVAVEVYTAQISLSDYSAAVGQDPASGLGEMGAIDPDGVVDMDAVLEGLETIMVDLSISLDDEGYVRELVTVIDMGSFANTVMAGLDDAPVGAEMEMIVETWQTFDDYGVDFDIAAPDATDRTSEVAGLLNS